MADKTYRAMITLDFPHRERRGAADIVRNLRDGNFERGHPVLVTIADTEIRGSLVSTMVQDLGVDPGAIVRAAAESIRACLARGGLDTATKMELTDAQLALGRLVGAVPVETSNE